MENITGNTSSEQRSLDWYRVRLGCFTGSRVGDLMKRGRKKDDDFSETARSYIYQVAAERLFNPAFLNDDALFSEYVESVGYTSRAMQWGTDNEDAAKRLYMRVAYPNGEEDAVLAEVGSCRHKELPYFAASPDGLVYERATQTYKTLEVKCPTLPVFMRYATEIKDAAGLKAVKPEYYWQVMAELSCTGADKAAFIAYCPWLTKPLHVVEIERDADAIGELEERVRLANEYAQI